ncbi:MAG: hypothetical protein M5U27_13245 [Gaiella sp.]|nr:hypothetical protein [Gaiella sp.]
MTTAADASPAGPSRGRIVLARTLVVVGVVLVAVSLLANWVKREALDPETFRSTSQELVASEEIRNQLAATTVEQLYANVDVAARLEARLPENVRPLAAPIAGLAREGIERAANQLLERPRVQSLFVGAASLAQAQVVNVLEGDTTRLSTTGGSVVLDLRPVMVRLGDRFGFLGDLEQTLPPDAGSVTILRSDELDTAQSVTQALKVVADWIWVPALLAWAAALWLVPGRRRKEVRAIGVGLVVAAVALLVVRRVAGSYLVDNLTQSDSVRPAVSSFWEILSDGLAEAAWALLVVGVIAAPRRLAHGGGGAGACCPPRGRTVARARRARVGRLRGCPAARDLGAAAAQVPRGGDPDRPRLARLRGGAQAGAARVRRGGAGRDTRTPGRPVAQAGHGAERGRRARTACPPALGGASERGGVRRGEGADPAAGGDALEPGRLAGRKHADLDVRRPARGRRTERGLRLAEVGRDAPDPEVQRGVRPPVDRDGELRPQQREGLGGAFRVEVRAPPECRPQPQIGTNARSRSGTSRSISGKRSVSPAK